MNTQAILRLAAARAHAANGTGRVIRQRHRLTMIEVAESIGVGEDLLSRWERGERRPRGEGALRWVDLLAELQRVDTTSAA